MDKKPQETQDPQKVEDLDVDQVQADEVKGGKDSPIATYSIINAWPKKYSG